MTTKKKKSAKERRVLIIALVVAAAIVAGSTFAWFSSQDEVTNRLSASADYNVSIAEDFQSPSDWIPGQEINKDVSAVNTGSVDAFVRMWLGGALRLVSEDAVADTYDVKARTDSYNNVVTAVTDESKLNVGLTYYSGSGANIKYYKTLSKDRINNPKDTVGHSSGASGVDGETNHPAEFSDVQTVQAGGVLVYAPARAGYHWTLEQAADMKVLDSANTTEPVTLSNLSKNTVVGSQNSTASGVTKLAGVKDITGAGSDENYYGTIDADTFTPETTGLYIFRRNIFETVSGTANEYEYSGYFFDADLNGGTYFALHTGLGDNGSSDYVLPSGYINEPNSSVPTADLVLPVTVAHAYLFIASEDLIQTDGFAWNYSDAVAATSAPAKFTLTYTNPKNNKVVSIDINLANIGAASEQWTVIKNTANDDKDYLNTFYYNNDVEAGATTSKLIDSVTLSSATENNSYLAFDFDLNVFMDSVQVTLTNEGVEGNASASPWAAKTVTQSSTNVAANIGATSAITLDGSEIGTIQWTKQS